jgi:glucosamine--fructose-6-phosphate aminotransferase (isomerizing)
MCGIVGYIGPRRADRILLEGLKRLEYRGYDSAGVAVVGQDGLEVVRRKGKLTALEDSLAEAGLTGQVGVGHTRWATHGRPSDENAHPHSTGRVAVVHNGILENYRELKARCEERGCTFSSETDTEVLAHLIDLELQSGKDIVDAVLASLAEVEGSYAIGVVAASTPDRIVVAKNASPLVLGLGEGENYAASDIPAILPYTKQMVFLEEGEVGVLTAGGVEIMTLEGERVDRSPKTIQWSVVQAEKAGYKHFMLKEIFEQPRAIEDTIRGRYDSGTGRILCEALGVEEQALRDAKRVILLACGTSYHAALYGQYMIERLVRIPAHAELASEFRNRTPVVGPDDLVVAISQSGETLDTLEAVKVAKEAGCRILSVANVLDSAIPRASDWVVYTHAGPEIGVASTKCYTAQLAALFLLGVAGAQVRGTAGVDLASLVKALVRLPGKMKEVLRRSDTFQEMAHRYAQHQDFLYLGRGLSFPTALEGALKLKEISYIHAEGYAAGEMKHGPIALIDRDLPVVVLMPEDEQWDKIKGNLEEVRAREGQVIALTSEGWGDEVRQLCSEFITVPATQPELVPLLTVVPLQLIAYYIADLKGTDVDQPRNLAKTVTVE